MGGGGPGSGGGRGRLRSAIGRPLREGDGVPLLWKGYGVRDPHPRGPRRAGHPVHPVRHLALGTVGFILCGRVFQHLLPRRVAAGAGDLPLARGIGEIRSLLRRPLRPVGEGERPGETRYALEPAAGAGGREGLRACLHPQVVPASGGDLPILPVLGDVVPGVRGGVSAGGGRARRVPAGRIAAPEAGPFRGGGARRPRLAVGRKTYENRVRRTSVSLRPCSSSRYG